MANSLRQKWVTQGEHPNAQIAFVAPNMQGVRALVPGAQGTDARIGVICRSIVADKDFQVAIVLIKRLEGQIQP